MSGYKYNTIEETVIEMLDLLKRGECWCGMSIGHPLIRDHSEGCKLAKELYAKLKDDKEK